jgi:hypothetical protein
VSHELTQKEIKPGSKTKEGLRMKKRNEGWARYLKTAIGRPLLWFSLVLSVASLLVAGIALSLQAQSRRQLFAQVEDPPSDNFANDKNHFLTFFNLIDDPVSACNYYNAIGAIRIGGIRVDLSPLCPLAPDAVFAFGITFNDWKLENGLKINPDTNGNRNPFDDDDATDPPEVSALFFNAVDLALARSMHGRTSIVNGEKRTAYYVCNYRNPSDFMHPANPILSLQDAKNDPDNSNAIACVAFDYSADPARNFTKFYVFVKGRLAASADLDGNGEKFVPGLCKACHGADNQARQPFTNNVVNGNIGAHFLPFDLDNFDYLDDSAFTRRAQESKFKQLNEMILNTDPAPVVRELIRGWYENTTEQNSPFVPEGWKGQTQLYRRVVKPSCRTCHVAMRPGPPVLPDSPDLDFDRFEGFKNQANTIRDRVCRNAEGITNPDVVRLFRSMPNSKVTFDLFWLDIVQRTVLVRFLRDAVVPPDPRLQCPPP